MKKAVSISTSLLSWLTLIVRSAKTPQVRSDKDTMTFGVKLVQFKMNEKFWVSVSPVSDIIIEVKFKNPVIGLRKTLLKFTTEICPLVNVFPSSGLTAIISTPPPIKFVIVKVPSKPPVSWSIASTIICEDDTILFTIKSAVKVFKLRLIDAEPMLSPLLIEDIIKEPPSDIKKAVSISTSLESCATVIIKSVKEQFKSDKETTTVGLIVQLKTKEDRSWYNSPSSEVILEVNVTVDVFGLWKILKKVIEEVFPLV